MLFENAIEGCGSDRLQQQGVKNDARHSHLEHRLEQRSDSRNRRCEGPEVALWFPYGDWSGKKVDQIGSHAAWFSSREPFRSFDGHSTGVVA